MDQARSSTSVDSALVAALTGAGYTRVEPSVLQPASLFLDLSGEEMGGRMFLTSDRDGNELCLRPEYTIPVARDYLASAGAGRQASLCYLGPVFRAQAGTAGEFVQAGLENFGRADREAADAEILAVAMAAADAAGHPAFVTRVGDVGLFARLLDVLALPPFWRRRLRRGFAHGESAAALLEPPAPRTVSPHAGVLAALAGADKAGAHALVEDLLSIAGISSVGGRSAGEIAERFLEQASLQTGLGLDARQAAVLNAFLAVSGDPDAAAQTLRMLARDERLDIGPALDLFETRTGFLAARGVDVAALDFSASFGRDLDYYTGFVFEMHDPARPEAKPIIGGGRYDTLLRRLGASVDIPAVGASLWVERLGTAEAAP